MHSSSKPPADSVTRRELIGGAAALAVAGTAGAQAGGTAPTTESKAATVKYKPNPPPVKLTLPKLTRGYADGPFGQVHYQDGVKGRPLVLIHQAPMSSRQFEGVFQALMDHGIRPIAIDCPGFGMSDATTFVPKVEDWARAVPPVLDKLRIRIADVLGHHTGAMVATEVEQQFPDRVRKLVLAGPLPTTPKEREEFLDGNQRGEIDFVYKPDGQHLAEAFMARYRLYGVSGDVPDPKLITRYTVERFTGYGPFWYGHHAAFIYDHTASIPRIKHPTLVITNTGDMINRQAHETKQMRPDFEFAEIQGGGVDIVDQHPQEWAAAIAKFLSA